MTSGGGQLPPAELAVAVVRSSRVDSARPSRQSLLSGVATAMAAWSQSAVAEKRARACKGVYQLLLAAPDVFLATFLATFLTGPAALRAASATAHSVVV